MAIEKIETAEQNVKLQFVLYYKPSLTQTVTCVTVQELSTYHSIELKLKDGLVKSHR